MKVLERLILPYLNASLSKAPSQHGFSPHHSTTSCLLPITQRVTDSFNNRKPARRVGLCAIDFSKAFDTVDTTILLRKVADSNLNPAIVRWLTAYLRGRQACVLYMGSRSPYRTSFAGVPQGSVILTSFADDFSIAESHVDPEELELELSADLEEISAWADELHLSISSSKTTVTHLSPNFHEHSYHPIVFLGQAVLPLNKFPTILGVTFDPLFRFNKHAEAVIGKGKKGLAVLRALAGVSWGQSKETLLTTYKAISQPYFTYACPIWFPNCAKSHIDKMQDIQTAAMRIITGCHQMASVAHLHWEMELLPVEVHLRMLCQQYLASAMRPSHPAHATVTTPIYRPRAGTHEELVRPPESLQSFCLDAITPYLTNGIVPENVYKSVITRIHTSTVQQTRHSLELNRVLDAIPPPISPSEQLLPREWRTTLSQLRSGFSKFLNSYLQRIGRARDDLCPHCLAHPHTTSHLFNCPTNPTPLSDIDLWINPIRVATFLKSSAPFDNLVDPPAPRPPPEPD